jgi:hypothetical protein
VAVPDVALPIALSVAAAAVVVLTIRKLPDLWNRPRPSEAVTGWFDAEQMARAWPVVAVLGSLALVTVAMAVWLSDGDGAPGWMGTVVAVSVCSVIVVGAPVGWFGRPRFLVPPPLRTRAGRDAQHEAVVYDVRPGPGSEDELPPYFVAMCSCDWVGRDRPTEEEARRDAEDHTSNVRPGLERPVG